MNKKVLKSMIILTSIFLVGIYILKIFFPTSFVFLIENEYFIKIGNFIDSSKWLILLVSGITTFIGLFLYLCAVNKSWKLPTKILLILLIVIILTRFLALYDSVLASGIMTCSMLVIPALMKNNSKEIAIVFSVHYISQLLSLKIRNLPYLLTNINSVTSIFLTSECYLWLLLFYLLYNFKKGDK